MKKLIAISFLFIFLFANTELSQLLKIPVLFHHYLEHTEKNHNQSFISFLNEHYINHHNHPDNKDHEHEKLPFKTANCAMVHISLAFVDPTQFSISSPIAFCDKTFPIYSGDFHSSAFVNNIWQPPKIN